MELHNIFEKRSKTSLEQQYVTQMLLIRTGQTEPVLIFTDMVKADTTKGVSKETNK